MQYGYDDYQRLIQVRYYPVAGGSEDAAAQVNITYDTNTVDSSYSQYAVGRMTTRRYTVGGRTFTDMYSYTQAGQVAGKRLRVTQTFGEPYPYPPQTLSADLSAAWS